MGNDSTPPIRTLSLIDVFEEHWPELAVWARHLHVERANLPVITEYGLSPAALAGVSQFSAVDRIAMLAAIGEGFEPDEMAGLAILWGITLGIYLGQTGAARVPTTSPPSIHAHAMDCAMVVHAEHHPPCDCGGVSG